MWVVLGSAGQLGRALSNALANAQVAHRTLTRTECDITSLTCVRDVLADIKPSVVINSAAWTSVDAAEDYPDEARLVNEIGARNVATACQHASSTLVHISTDYVFDGSARTPIPEYAVCAPTTVYGRTKRAGEIAVMNEHADMSYIVRTAWLYSEYGHNFAKTMMRRALAGAAVNVVNDQFGQPTNAHDLAAHLIDIVIKRAPYGLYHGTNSGHGSWFDFAKTIFSLVGADTDLVSAINSSSYATKAERPKYSVLSHARTISNGIQEMRPWESALAESAVLIRDSLVKEEK